MKTRMLSTGLVFVAAAAVAASAAYSQQPTRTVAKLTGVQGNVLVSQGDAMVVASNDQRVPAGARMVTTAGAKGTISYDTGCDVRLDQNKRYTVRDTGECAALSAGVEPIVIAQASGAVGGTEGAGAGAAGGLGVTGLVIAGVTFGAITWGAIEGNKQNDDNFSPN